MRAWTAAATAAAVALSIATAPAGAASLVYLDQDYNVATAAPDGTRAKPVTTDGSASSRYSPPTVDDSGGIVAWPPRFGGESFFRVVDQEGATRSGPWLFSMPLCSSVAPFRNAISSDGVFVAATYIHGNMCEPGATTSFRTKIVGARSPTLGETYPSYTDMLQPRWLRRPGIVLAGLVNDVLKVQRPADGTLDDWIVVDGATADIDGFDVSPVADQVLLETSDNGGGAFADERRDLLLIAYTGPPGSMSTISTPCATDAFIANGRAGFPRWSPDGTQIAWTGPDGIYVSPAPVPAPAAPGVTPQCALQPRLVVPGGRDVDWSRVDLSTPSVPPVPGPGGGGTTPPGGGGAPAAGGGTPPAGGGSSPRAPALAIAATPPRALSVSKLAKGVALRVRTSAAGTLSAILRVPARQVGRKGRAIAVASASVRVKKAGRVTITLKLTAAGRRHARRLRGAAATLVIEQARAKRSFGVKLGR